MIYLNLTPVKNNPVLTLCSAFHPNKTFQESNQNPYEINYMQNNFCHDDFGIRLLCIFRG